MDSHKFDTSTGREDILFAVFNGEEEIADEMYEEVKKFVAYVKQREGYNK